MASPPTKGSSKSPRKTRKGKAAAAPETESEETSKSPKGTRNGGAAAAPGTESEMTSKSPEGTRQDKATASETASADFNNEDYNIRSPERTKFLTEIKSVINNAPVSPALWACCQLADMNRLQTLAETDEDIILGYEDSLAVIALRCELLGFWTKSTVNMPTVNRDSAIPGF
jgi:hypothetical protein